jgi:hypothetical protein
MFDMLGFALFAKALFGLPQGWPLLFDRLCFMYFPFLFCIEFGAPSVI